ncbi:MAG: right-handed parallel beta-helix repeat-containing protein [Myxococcales bacterium]|nr:right-handed parallel beta-helix repeat-containing protein [Myxococcales bacterium]
MRFSRWTSVLVGVVMVGCGGSDDPPATTDTGVDTGVDSGTDTLVDTGADTIVDTGAEVETGPSCATALAPTDTVLEVDKSYKGGASNGTKACPFVTVTAALVARKSVITKIHVRGDSTSPFVYDEASSLDLPADLALEGDGPDATVIKGVGTCLTTTCAILVKGAGTLKGLRVESTTGNAIVAQSFGGRVTITNVVAANSGLAGILVTADVALGPNAKATGNKGAGVHSTGTGPSGLLVTGDGNEFSSNGTHGILVVGDAPLSIEGATVADKNTQNGVSLEGTVVVGPTTRHGINKLSAKGNGRAGVSILNGQKVLINQSVLNGNAMGLYYDFAGKPVGNLDIGQAPLLAGDVFGGATSNNTAAGVFLCNTPGLVVAGGNKWSKCAPSSATLTSCTATVSTYSDVVLAGTSGGSVNATGCSVGP